MLEMTAEQIAELKAAMNYRDPETQVAPAKEFSGYDIYEAIGSNSLTPEMCLFLHEQGMSWGINVRRD
jgi:hypothetical protein